MDRRWRGSRAPWTCPASPLDQRQRLKGRSSNGITLSDGLDVGAGLRGDRGGRTDASAVLPPRRLRANRVTWEPPVDVFEDELEVVVLVALPGVPAQRIEVTAEAGELVVRAESSLPFAASPRAVRLGSQAVSAEM